MSFTQSMTFICQRPINHNSFPCELVNQLCRRLVLIISPPKNCQVAKRRSVLRVYIYICYQGVIVVQNDQNENEEK